LNFEIASENFILRRVLIFEFLHNQGHQPTSAARVTLVRLSPGSRHCGVLSEGQLRANKEVAGLETDRPIVVIGERAYR